MKQGCRIIKIGESIAIMCGGEPTDHICNDDLDILLLKNGGRIENTRKNWDNNVEQINGGSGGCSICGRLSIDDAPYL